VDSVCTGLTSSNRVTFAEKLYRFGLDVRTDVLWLDLPKSAPPTALDPRLHRQRCMVLTIERGNHFRAGLSVKTDDAPTRR
jgi:hypothetical protein